MSEIALCQSFHPLMLLRSLINYIIEITKNFRIFTESGSGKNGRQKCYKDDIMSVYCDTEEKDIRFYRNDQLVS